MKAMYPYTYGDNLTTSGVVNNLREYRIIISVTFLCLDFVNIQTYAIMFFLASAEIITTLIMYSLLFGDWIVVDKKEFNELQKNNSKL